MNMTMAGVRKLESNMDLFEGFHSNKCLESYILDCDTMWHYRWSPTFQKNMLPPPSGLK
jgi:hypothetical protein